MDIIHDWPLSSRSHFMSMLDVSVSTLTDMGLVETVRVGGSGRKRYALTDRGIAYLCRRDRVEVKAKLNRMSVAPRADGDFRGGSVRTVVKEIDHNDGLNYVLSRLWSDPRGMGEDDDDSHPQGEETLSRMYLSAGAIFLASFAYDRKAVGYVPQKVGH